MKNCIYTFLILSFFSTQAQVVFCPPGAEWNYNFAEYWTPGYMDNYQITYTKDSISGPDTMKVLTHNYFYSECAFSSSNCAQTLIKQIGDTIFMKNACTGGIWQILYNFSAQPGHAWYNSIKTGSLSMNTANYTIAVMATNTVVVNGFTLKELTVQYTFKYGTQHIVETPVKITERFGCSKNLFNFRNKIMTDCNYVARFLCYKDSTFGLKQFTTYPCDYSNPVGFDEIIKAQYPTKVYPNPVSEIIQFYNLPCSGTYSFNLMDFSGKLIISSVIGPESQIDIRDQESGIYFLELSSESLNQTFRSKIIKQ